MHIEIYQAIAGSGKTQSLINRVIKYNEEGVPLDKIAFVSFTKKAAREAQDRIRAHFNISLARVPYFRTLHSMAFKAVGAHRENMVTPALLAELGLGDMRPGVEGINWMTDYSAMEQFYRNNPVAFRKLSMNRVDARYFADYMRTYSQEKKKRGVYDFTDLLEQYIKDKHTEDVEIACLDEMQDATPLQWRVAFQAFKNCKNIIVAGDPRQCIYRFAGSDGDILTKLRGEQHWLGTSYRVPTNIMEVANKASQQLHLPDGTSQVEGGTVSYIASMGEVRYDATKSYYLLARTKAMFDIYVEWCRLYCLNYIIDGKVAASWNMALKGDKYSKLLIEKGIIREMAGKESANIVISTIHGVKGGEADVVVLQGDMGWLAAQNYLDGSANEHSVFYTAVTRAKQQLYIMSPRTKAYYPYIY